MATIETLTCAWKGVRYHLGFSAEIHVNGKLCYVFIPSVPARPPFMFPRKKALSNRISTILEECFEKGIPVPREDEPCPFTQLL